MNLFFHIISFCVVVLGSIIKADVCTDHVCQCSKDIATVNCDGIGWTSLKDLDFPSYVNILTLINNQLKFNTIDDRSKIENLNSLSVLSLNRNPLGIIPPFNDTKIKSLLLQDTSLTSAAFPLSYIGSLLQTISLSNNKIRTISENDFRALRNSKIKRLDIDSASLSTIDQNAFTPLITLQGLSLQNNQLKSCEFLPTLPLLSSIKLDGNQFTSLPQQLSAPNKIINFFFTRNSISVIDESSPLHTWLKTNKTNIKIYLANNSFDCCQSVWFIRFLNTSSHFIGDASSLTCATPSDYAGQFLMKLNPDKMNCGGVIPDKSWWTTARTIGVAVGGSVTLLVVLIFITIFTRRRRSRSGYTEIGGIDDPLPTAPTLVSSELLFPPYGEDHDDTISSYSTAVTRNTTESEAPTLSTATGVPAGDNN